jgi:AcrR family transcriptional regulator
VVENEPRRSQARTRLARRAVLDAALALFGDRGYGATTIEAISSASDVPQATVYRLFSSKPGILKALLDTSVGGDEEPVAVADRPHVQSLMNTPQPAEVLARLAAVSVEINSRTAPIYGVLVNAAGSDAEAAALFDDLTRQRQEGQGRVAAMLARSKALRPGFRAQDAADIIHALASPELFRLLVTDRNWSPDRYQRWLADSLASQLLPPPPPPS